MMVKDYLFHKASRNRIPLGGTFEISPVCNFSCRMCYVRKTREELRREGKKERTADEWIELGRKCRDAGMLYLLLTGGEPFLYPEFHYLYESLQNMGLVLSINTNGTMIDDRELEWLKEHAPARVNITLYGASPETYGRICGNPAGYEKAVQAILKIKEARIPVVINASIIPENADDLEAIIKFGKDHDIVVHAATYMFPPVRRRPEDTDSRLTPEESGRLNVMKQYYMLDKKSFLKAGQRCLELAECDETAGGDNFKSDTWGAMEGMPMQCRAGRSTFWVSWDGKMTTCGIMDFPVVKYPFEEEFIDCWEDMTDKVRKATVLKECRGCPKMEFCHPCAAIIHSETGDVNKKAPYLCQMSDAIVACWREMLGRKDEKDVETEEKQ